VVQVKQNKVMRVLPLENEAVNECWLSDKDRFSYEGLNTADRLTRPMVKKNGQWSFDTKAGITEVIDRRIGENELNAIKVCRDYIAAQKVYASKDRDGDNVLEFAQKLLSTPGTQDGLYWHAEPGEDESPIGPYITAAKVEGAKPETGYFGYHFRILRAQGNNVAGGAYDYVINGNMIAGYALIAWPVKWGDTGIMTFACSHAGVVYERNLGPDTSAIVKRINRFNPLASWAMTAGQTN
jgi:hypothetical protein